MAEPRVRPIDLNSRKPSRRVAFWLRLAGVTAAILVGVLLWRAGGPSPDETPAGPTGRPEVAIRGFFDALAVGDGPAALSLLADQWSVLVLPGLSAAVMPDDPAADRLAFEAQVASFRLGRCSVRPSAAARRSLVECSVQVDSPYRSALGIAETVGTVTAPVSEGRIDSIATTLDDRFTVFDDYCSWVMQAYPTQAAALFDDGCRPVETERTAPLHLEMTAAYARAGREPGPPSPVAVVRNFAMIHNSGRSPIALFADVYPVVYFPGMPVGSPTLPFPRLDDYLTWSSRLYDIELGPCTSSALNGPGLTIVSCRKAALGGPLPGGLGVGLVAAPMEFFVRKGRILDVSGRTPQALLAAFDSFCRRRLAEDGDGSLSIVGDACVPRYDTRGADGLLAVLGAS